MGELLEGLVEWVLDPLADLVALGRRHEGRGGVPGARFVFACALSLILSGTALWLWRHAIFARSPLALRLVSFTWVMAALSAIATTVVVVLTGRAKKRDDTLNAVGTEQTPALQSPKSRNA